ncbi:MAG: site-specific integrase [Rhodospirillaceae bacterium]
MNDAPAILSTTALADALAAAEEFASYSLSDGTRDAYRRAFSLFRDRCDRLGVPSLPCSVEDLSAVIGAMAKEGRSAARLGVILAAVGMAHRLAEMPDPTTSQKVRLLIKGVRNIRGTASARRQPLYALLRPDQTSSDLERVLAGIPDFTLVGRRDRALLLIGFAAALRRSELCALTVHDVEPTERGIILTIRRSKGDQAARGQMVTLPFGSSPHCPVGALTAWTAAAHITEGRLFRAIDRHGNLGETLSPGAVALILKRRLKFAGLDPSAFSAHSLRSGFLTSAADNGANVWDLMSVSRHKDVRTLQSYVKRREGFEHYPGKGLL